MNESFKRLHVKNGLFMGRIFPWWLGFMFLLAVGLVIFTDAPWWIIPVAGAALVLMYFMSRLNVRRFEEKAKDLGM